MGRLLDIERRLSASFYKLGCKIERNPVITILVPIILSCIFGFGWREISYTSNLEHRYAPQNAEAFRERAAIEHYFPTNYSEFIRGHESRRYLYVDVIITEKKKEKTSIIRDANIWNIAKFIEKTVQNRLKISIDGLNTTFNDVCAKRHGKCLENDMSFSDLLFSVNTEDLRLYYPRTDNPITNTEYYLPQYFGGSELSVGEAQVLQEAKALRLSYNLDPNSKYSEIWEDAILACIFKMNSVDYDVVALNSKSIEKELIDNIQQGLSIMPSALGILTTFAIYAKLHSNVMKISSALASIIGIINTAIAIISSWGILFFNGEPMQAINLASIFLLVGIGMDDSFLVLSAWERSRSIGKGPEKLGSCYKEAGTAITISSLTNIGSLLIGALMPGFRAVQIFCKFTAVAILFLYMWTLLIFGGSLIIIDRVEMIFQRYRLGCLKLIPRLYESNSKSEAVEGKELNSDHKNSMKKVNHNVNSEGIVKKTVTKYIPIMLSNGYGKILVILLYICYMAFAGYGYTIVMTGLSRENLVSDISYSRYFFEKEDDYFRRNPYRFHVMINGDIDYSTTETQQKILELLQSLKHSMFIDSNSNFTENWLDISSRILKERYNNNLSFRTEDEYVRELIIAMKSNHRTNSVYKDWIHVSEENKIEASRFFLQSSQVKTSYQEMKMINDLRKIVKNNDDNFKITIFNPYQPFWDQLLSLNELSNLAIIFSGISVVLVAFLLLPQKKKAEGLFCVTFTVFSIALGIQGFMPFLGIYQDVISMICLIMATGFSVDYSAHTTYHFLLSMEENEGSDSASTDAIYSIFDNIGMPLLEAGISTIIPIASLLFLPSYILKSFAKLLCIVIVFGIFHGLLVIPVLLSLFTDFGKTYRQIAGSKESKIRHVTKDQHDTDNINDKTLKRQSSALKTHYEDKNQDTQHAPKINDLPRKTVFTNQPNANKSFEIIEYSDERLI